MHVHVEGLEDHVRQVVKEEVAAALAVREDDPWLTSDEAAEYLGIARSTIHDLVCSKALPRHGGRKTRLMFRRSELDTYLDARGQS
jgi:excisionase family DNA binding protein